MLCFKFYSREGVALRHCEEIIHYSAYKEDGIHIGVILIVDVLDANAEFFVIHRRTLDNIELFSPNDWVSGDGTFPFLHIFSHLTPQRCIVNPSSHKAQLRLLEIDCGGQREVPLEAAIAGLGNSIAFEHLPDVAPQLRPDAPYTCLRFHSFPQEAGLCLIGLHCHIGDPTFTDLVPEDDRTGTRRYRVYGPAQIEREITMLDVPKALSRGDEYRAYAVQLEKLQSMRTIMPKQYSIVALNNLNCNPDRLRCLNMSSNLKDVTRLVDPAVFEHPGLSSVGTCIYWFICQDVSEDFYLQLSGPIALAPAAV